jgi:hypothetical protein
MGSSLRQPYLRSVRRHLHLTLKVLLGFLIVAGLGACESMKPTPQQLLVEDAWAACQREGRIPLQVKLTRIQPDGTYWIEGNAGSYGFADTQACMTEKARGASR